MEESDAIVESKLAQLRDGGQRCFIVIRIARIWDSIIPPNKIFAGIDFLAIDSEGFAMHGTIPVAIADEFRPQIQEGHVYKIEIFEVGPRNKKTHIALPLETLLIFNVSTIIEEVTQGVDSFPRNHFNFASYEQIMGRNQRVYHLTDAIGVLGAATDVTTIELNDNKGAVNKREIFLTLTSGQKIRITIWDPKIVELDIPTLINLGYKPVLAIAGLYIKDNQGNKQINACSVTRFYIDPQIPEASEVRKSIPDDGLPIKMLSSDEVDNLRDYTYPDAKKATIRELLYLNPATIKGIKYRVKAHVLQFQTRQGWYYNACRDCTYGVGRGPAGLKVSMILRDGKFKLQTIVFGNLAKSLTGIDVTKLTVFDKMNTTTIPVVANRILNKEFEFVLGLADQDYGPGLNFKIFYFTPVELEQPGSTPVKRKEAAQSSTDAPHGTQAEIDVTPNAGRGICADDATPSATPSDNTDDMVSKSSQRTSKRVKTWHLQIQLPSFICLILKSSRFYGSSIVSLQSLVNIEIEV
ncbi:Nucleic acid-binding protein [Corchorus olitorius]|uniref:Nucleic acid-binding protein n=1 Tax=Corchorus olitorius TaxID=93759 RepID=A0A1R3HWJ2_9ROSI|nr:Nucleic acid-binding protein [Corchorus olitorius]